MKGCGTKLLRAAKSFYKKHLSWMSCIVLPGLFLTVELTQIYIYHLHDIMLILTRQHWGFPRAHSCSVEIFYLCNTAKVLYLPATTHHSIDIIDYVTGIGNGSNLHAIRVAPGSLLRPHPLNICVSDCMFSCFTYMFTKEKLYQCRCTRL